jgi:hypothetical protein
MSEIKHKQEVERKETTEFDETHDENRDPITGAPGSHPVGVAVGGTAAGAAGAVIGGLVGGPAGAVVGGAIGAVAGGLTGKSVAEVIDPTVEEAYWREHYNKRPYYSPGRQYYEYGTAYRYGWESAGNPEYSGRSFEEIESDLEREWPSYRGSNAGEWKDLKEAIRDAFNRIRERK